MQSRDKAIEDYIRTVVCTNQAYPIYKIYGFNYIHQMDESLGYHLIKQSQSEI